VPVGRAAAKQRAGKELADRDVFDVGAAKRAHQCRFEPVRHVLDQRVEQYRLEGALQGLLQCRRALDKALDRAVEARGQRLQYLVPRLLAVGRSFLLGGFARLEIFGVELLPLGEIFLVRDGFLFLQLLLLARVALRGGHLLRVITLIGGLLLVEVFDQ
jgi:hypothetical protein